MLPKAIVDIFHARLHAANNEIQFPQKMTVPEFVDWNKGVLNRIAKDLEEEYDINPFSNRRLFEKAIKNYLVAEGMYGGKI